jgi:hypothetical protein
LQQRADRAQEAETRKRQEEERRQKSKRDAQAAIVKLREEEEKRRKKAFQKQKLLKERREQELLQRQKQQQRNSTERKPADRKPTDRKPITKQPVRQNIALEKPKVCTSVRNFCHETFSLIELLIYLHTISIQVVQDLSFDEIMKRARQVPTDKKSLIMQKKPPPPVPTYNRAKPSVSEVNGKPMPKAPSSTPNKAHATPSKLSNKASIYTSRPSSSTSTAMAGTQMGSVRDRLKNIALAPPQRLNTVKRDLRSVEEIQQDVRRQLGKSANEDRPARDRVRERQPVRRSLSPRSASARDRAPDRRPIGRSLSPRPIPRQQRPPGHMPFRPNRARRYSDEDEDDDLDGFIDDGDVEEDNNNYSDVISKMFRYDRKR